MKITNIKSFLYDFRFEVLAGLLCLLIFGGGFPPAALFDDFVLPVILLLVAVMGILFTKNHQHQYIRLIFLGFACLVLLSGLFRLLFEIERPLKIISLLVFTILLATLSLEVFRQMFRETNISRSIIVAAFDCYLLLGVLGALLFSLILLLDPEAFTNIHSDTYVFHKMTYFSFITLTSIGYGDITPNSIIAEKFTAFFGLIGHFYSVVIVGIIVGKYISIKEKKDL